MKQRKATINLPAVLTTTSELWENILRAWPYLNVKMFVNQGQVITKKLLYRNPHSEKVQYTVVTNMENVIEIKNNLMNLSPDEKDYIRFIIKAPQTACKIHVKMALIDSTENPAEGMEFDIVVNNAK